MKKSMHGTWMCWYFGWLSNASQTQRVKDVSNGSNYNNETVYTRAWMRHYMNIKRIASYGSITKAINSKSKRVQCSAFFFALLARNTTASNWEKKIVENRTFYIFLVNQIWNDFILKALLGIELKLGERGRKTLMKRREKKTRANEMHRLIEQ